MGQHGEQRLHYRQTIGRHIAQHRFMERFTGRVAHGVTEALEGEADSLPRNDISPVEQIHSSGQKLHGEKNYDLSYQKEQANSIIDSF